MKFRRFEKEYKPVDVNKKHEESLTRGQVIADKVADTVGSWPFIIGQSFILTVWLLVNGFVMLFRWDPYPFILLNLMLSFQAAYSAPFVMMSQNRQADKDRIAAEADYHTNTIAEEENRHIMDHLDHQDAVLHAICQELKIDDANIYPQAPN